MSESLALAGVPGTKDLTIWHNGQYYCWTHKEITPEDLQLKDGNIVPICPHCFLSEAKHICVTEEVAGDTYAGDADGDFCKVGSCMNEGNILCEFCGKYACDLHIYKSQNIVMCETCKGILDQPTRLD